MIGSVIVIAIMTAIYCSGLASFQSWDIGIGAGLSMLTLLVFRQFLETTSDKVAKGMRPSFFERIIAFFPFAGKIVWDILVGTWRVLMILIGVRPLNHPGIVKIPIGDRSPTGVAVSGMATGLAPGTVLVDVDWEEGVMLVHAIEAADPDEIRRAHQDFYEKYQRHVFP
jgi:multisubunit Na+/H+ antiporter MnhE subunit